MNKNLDEFINKKVEKFMEWDITKQELKEIIRETAKATVEACRPVERGKYWNHDTITGQELTLEEFEQKAKAWLGEEK